jgi:hypothetical protein
MALGYFLCPPFCASNYLSFARQNTDFSIDRNASFRPNNSKHIVLPSRVAAFGLNIGLGPHSPFSRPILHLCLTASCLHSRRSRILFQRLPVLAKGRKEYSAYPAYDRAIIRAVRIDDGGGLAFGAGQVVRHLMNTFTRCITPICAALQQRQKRMDVPARACDETAQNSTRRVFNIAQTVAVVCAITHHGWDVILSSQS